MREAAIVPPLASSGAGALTLTASAVALVCGGYVARFATVQLERLS